MPNLRYFLLLPFILAVSYGQNTKEAQLVRESIAASTKQLQQLVSDAVAQRGGNLESQHLHLVLAFSTGHYPRDPLGAEAARELAWQLVKDLATPGDKLSVFAWELDVYDSPTPEPLVITQAVLEQERPVRDLFPKTARVGSAGGHDTERALVEIGRHMGEGSQDAVLILLTNSAASVAPKGASLLGSNEPSYRGFLQRYDRLQATTATGASAQLPYEIRQPDGELLSRSIDVVVAVPRQFVGRPIEGRTRYEVPRQVPAEGVHQGGSSIALLVIGAGALAALGFLVYTLIAGKASAPRTLRIVGKDFEIPGGGWSVGLAEARVGEEVLHIAGGGYAERVDKTRVLPKSLRSVPPAQIARIERSPKGVRVIALPPNRLTVDGVDYPDSHELVAGREYRVCVSGEGVTNPVLGLQPFNVELHVSVES